MKKYLNILILLPGLLNALNAPADKKSDSSHSSSYWSPEKIMKMKSISSVQVSPDGNKVIFAVSGALITEERSEFINQLYLSNSDGSNTIQLTRGDKNNTNPKWSPDGKHIAFISNRDGKNNLYIMQIDGGETERISDVKTAVSDFDWSNDGKMIAYTMTDTLTPLEEKNKKAKDDWYFIDENYKQARLYLISLERASAGKRKTRQLTKENRHITSFDWSPDNKWIVYAHTLSSKAGDVLSSDIAQVNTETLEVRMVAATSAVTTNPMFSPDGKWIAYQSGEEIPVSGGERFIKIVSSTAGKPLTLAQTMNEAASLIGWGADGKTIFVGDLDHTLFKIYKLGTDGKNVSEWSVSDSQTHTLITMNRTGTYLGMVLQSLAKAEDVFVTPVSSYKPVRVSNVNPEIASYPVPKTELISWKAKDGKAIEGLLTYPLHYDKTKKYPLLVRIAGGPPGGLEQIFIGNYTGTMGRYPIIAVAEKGYFVLRVNHRGGGGYGRDFRLVVQRHWGEAEYPDLMSGVDYVIAMGNVDSGKMGVMGWSYGGYLSSWIIAHTNRFKAASIGAPVIDLATMQLTSDISFISSYMKKKPWEDWDIYHKLSPLRYVNNIRTPVLLQHCEGDIRVPISQGIMFYRALKENGVPVRFMVLPRQTHGPTEPRMLQRVMEANLAWMDQHILGKEKGF